MATAVLASGYLWDQRCLSWLCAYLCVCSSTCTVRTAVIGAPPAPEAPMSPPFPQIPAPPASIPSAVFCSCEHLCRRSECMRTAVLAPALASVPAPHTLLSSALGTHPQRVWVCYTRRWHHRHPLLPPRTSRRSWPSVGPAVRVMVLRLLLRSPQDLQRRY